MSSFVAMFIFALVTSISPGPVNIIAMMSGANYGFNRTLPHILGATVGFTSILLLLGLGFSTVFNANPEIARYIGYFGATFLLFMSYKIAAAPFDQEDERRINHAPGIFAGLLYQWLNPKAWIVAVAGVTVFSHNGSADTAVIIQLSLIFFFVCFTSISAWASIGVAIQSILSNPKHYRYFNVSMGCLLFSTVFYLLFQ